MPLKIGGTDVANVKLGSSQVSAIYQGTEAVWANRSDYTHVGYWQGASSNQNPKTVPIDIGPENPNRWVIICLSNDIAGGGTAVVNTVDVNGVSLTKAFEASSSSLQSTSIWWGKVPTGTNVNMVLGMAPNGNNLPLGTSGYVIANDLIYYNDNGQSGSAGVVVSNPNQLTIAAYGTGSAGPAGVVCTWSSDTRTPINLAYGTQGAAQGIWVGVVQWEATGAGGVLSVSANPNVATSRSAISLLTLDSG